MTRFVARTLCYVVIQGENDETTTADRLVIRWDVGMCVRKTRQAPLAVLGRGPVGQRHRRRRSAGHIPSRWSRQIDRSPVKSNRESTEQHIGAFVYAVSVVETCDLVGISTRDLSGLYNSDGQ